MFDVRFVPSKQQLADIFTKPLPNARFDYLKSKLILDKSKLSLRGDVTTPTDAQNTSPGVESSFSSR